MSEPKPFRIVDVKHIDEYKLPIRWANRKAMQVDLQQEVYRLRGLRKLRNRSAFSRAARGEGGHSVVWSREMDMGADRLWSISLEQNGHADAAELEARFELERSSRSTRIVASSDSLLRERHVTGAAYGALGVQGMGGGERSRGRVIASFTGNARLITPACVSFIESSRCSLRDFVIGRTVGYRTYASWSRY